MVLDDATAFVTSFNWTTSNLIETRDYGIVTQRWPEVTEIIECFEADWHRQAFAPHEKSHLLSPARRGLERDRVETSSCSRHKRNDRRAQRVSREPEWITQLEEHQPALSAVSHVHTDDRRRARVHA
jgi:hypothetical protein